MRDPDFQKATSEYALPTISGSGQSFYDKLNIDAQIKGHSERMPKLKTWKSSEVVKDQTIVFSLQYIFDAEIKTISIPLFLSLKNISPQHLASDSRLISYHNNTTLFDFKECFIRLAKLPISMAVGISTFINSVSLWFQLNNEDAPTLTVTPATSSSNANSFSKRFYLQILALQAQVSYLLVSEMKGRLGRILDDIARDLEQDEFSMAYHKLNNLNLFYQALLHPKFPNNSQLLWRYSYFKGVILDQWRRFHEAENIYKIALGLSATPEEKTLVLSNLINMIDKQKELSTQAAYQQACDVKIRNYAQLVSENTLNYKDTLFKLKKQLLLCVDFLKKK